MAVVANSGLVPISAPTSLMLLGLAQVASGVLALAQVGALVALPLLVSWQDPLLWFHPFGPMTKNFPIRAGSHEVLGMTTTVSVLLAGIRTRFVRVACVGW